MVERVRIATGDKVEIIDSTSPYFGKTGVIMDINMVPVTMLGSGVSKKQTRFQVKLDDTGDKVIFNLSQIKKVK